MNNEALTADQIADMQMKYAGTIGLLCQCSVKLGNGYEADDLRDSIEQAVMDWCTKSGWTMHRVLHRIDVEPPRNPK